MQQSYGREEDYGGRVAGCRQDKVLAAKMAFGASAGGHRRTLGMTEPEQSVGEERVARKHRYGLWRFGAAVILFFAFMAGAHFNVSIRGWNQERLEKMLSDDTKWKQVVREVSNVMEALPGGAKKGQDSKN